jgi:sulfite exporter TauE/SafE
LIHINAPPHRAGHQSAMLESLHWLGALCRSDTAFQGGLLLGLLVAGAAGSVVHCGPMCGAFVLGQVSERIGRLPAGRLCERQRISNGLLLPYHLGRLTTYAGLGALAAGSVALFGRQTWFGTLSGALLAIAALLFLTKALALVLPLVGNIDRAPRIWGRLIGALARKIERGSVSGEYLLGVALGFLPCGFLYGAIAAAAASGRPAAGAAAMVSFGLGTTPILMVVGIAGHAAGRRWSHAVTAAAPLLMALNATLLLALAWERMT